MSHQCWISEKNHYSYLRLLWLWHFIPNIIIGIPLNASCSYLFYSPCPLNINFLEAIVGILLRVSLSHSQNQNHALICSLSFKSAGSSLIIHFILIMHRCPGPQCPYYNKNNQNSTLLQLPGEIRTAIYRQALVRSTPIDLWPQIGENLENSLARGSDPRTSSKMVRRQADLVYVRKRMATGILGTCRQIYREAAAIFWSENEFEFTGKGSWLGLYRFLLTIGPHARQFITAIGVGSPLHKRWFNHNNQPRGEDIYNARLLDRYSKNFPKMHMVKVRRDVESCRLAFEILARDKNLRQLRLIVPASYGVTSVGISRLWTEKGYGKGLESMDFLDSIVLVLRAGSRFNVLDYTNQANRMGWDLLIEHGCLLKNAPWGYEVVTEEQFHPALRSEYAYLDCMRNLFPEEEEEISVHANGGRVKTGQNRLARKLKGFGAIPRKPTLSSYRT